MAATRKRLSDKFCSCIKQVQSGSRIKEPTAIAICVKSVLHTRRRTLKRFRCSGKKPKLITQKRLK